MRSTRWLWAALLAVGGAAVAIVLVPVFFIRPFSPQTPGKVAVAYHLRTANPWAAPLLAAVAAAIVVALFRRRPHWALRVLAVVLLLPVLGAAWQQGSVRSLA